MAQANIHPKYYQTTITCTACNSDFVCGSTKGPEIRVDTCSNCHPFYTGKQTFVSAKGTVERYLKKASKQVSDKKPKIKEKSAKNRTTKMVSLDNFKPKPEKPKPKTEDK